MHLHNQQTVRSLGATKSDARETTKVAPIQGHLAMMKLIENVACLSDFLTTHWPRMGTPPTAMLCAIFSFHSSGPVM